MSEATALTIVGVTIVLGGLLAAALLLPLRRRWYQHWSPASRWSFLGAVSFFSVFGAGLWIALWYERHPAAGVFQFVVCAHMFWKQVIAPWRASASPVMHSPPPTA